MSWGDPAGGARLLAAQSRTHQTGHNDHYTGELNPKWDALYNCKKAGRDMLTLTFSTDTLRCGLYTEHLQPPRQHFLREVVL